MVAISTAYTAEPCTSCLTGGKTRFNARELGSGQSAQVCLCMYLHIHLIAWAKANFSCLSISCLSPQDRRNSHNYWFFFFPGRRNEDFLALDWYFTYLCLQCIVKVEKKKARTICFSTHSLTLQSEPQAAIGIYRSGSPSSIISWPCSKNKRSQRQLTSCLYTK